MLGKSSETIPILRQKALLRAPLRLFYDGIFFYWERSHSAANTLIKSFSFELRSNGGFPRFFFFFAIGGVRIQSLHSTAKQVSMTLIFWPPPFSTTLITMQSLSCYERQPVHVFYITRSSSSHQTRLPRIHSTPNFARILPKRVLKDLHKKILPTTACTSDT